MGAIQALAIATLFFVSLSSQAQWTLNPDQSDVLFLSTKNTHITETSHFKTLSGQIDQNGQATLKIDLASVDSLIPIRNERMAKFLFETVNFPSANISVKIDEKQLKALKSNGSLSTTITAKVDLHGAQKDVTADVFATQGENGTITLLTRKPILIQAADFALKGGIDKLQEIAKLNAISYAVPVSFKLTYQKK